MKRLRRYGFLSLSLVSVTAAVIACSGDDPNYDDLAGQDGGGTTPTPTPDGSGDRTPGTDTGNGPEDAGPPTCDLEGVTSFGCDGAVPIKCYGLRGGGSGEADADADPPPETTQTCVTSATACEPNEVRWRCNSVNQCGSGACCIPGTVQTQTECSLRNVTLTPDAGGSVCVPDEGCPANTVKLCQSNGQCAEDEFCSQVRVFGLPDGVPRPVFAACVKTSLR